jgi:hypothetical protein
VPRKPDLLRLPYQIINTTGWNDAWLARMVSHCVAEVELDPAERRLRLARFSLAHNCTYRGWAYGGRRSIRVKINPLIIYPFVDQRKGFPDIEYGDPIELAVMITAHELAHLRWPDASEAQTERRGRRVLLDFRRERLAIAARWGDPGPGPVRPETVYQLTCPTCGSEWHHVRRPRVATMYCTACFPVEADARRSVARLLCERIPTPETLSA